MGVMNINQPVTSLRIAGLSALTILEEDRLVSLLFVPNTDVLVDVKVALKLDFRAPAPVPPGLGTLQESKGHY